MNMFSSNGHSVTMITGGAGFIGSNLAHRLLQQGRPVLIYDNLSRSGSEQNLRWLQATHGNLVSVEIADVRDIKRLQAAAKRARQVFHFAAQVAVTSSLINPVEDFHVNVLGTFNLLEALRALDNPPPLIFTSTNKVYGDLTDIPLCLNGLHYEPADERIRQTGISESHTISFHTPYGCSKGTAEQYVLDYARSFGLRTAVFRMSCVYGPHQFGTEDQGWIAHFVNAALAQQSITICGDGKQVRDALFIDDLVEAFLLAEASINDISGEVFNLGGGTANAVSLLEVLNVIKALPDTKLILDFENWRTGDQRYYVSDTGKFHAATGWTSQVSVPQGIRKIYDWLTETRFTVDMKGASQHGSTLSSR